jgi:hypothetical protein
MNGTVIIRSPNRLLQIQRAQLAEVEVGEDRVPCERSTIRWKHIGDHSWTEIDVDVLQDDADETDYAQLARDLLFVIADMRETSVTLTWRDDAKEWHVYYAPQESNANLVGGLSDDLVGYGSLGR